MSARLTLAAEAGLLEGAGSVALYGAPGGLALDWVDVPVTVVQPMMPDAAAWQARGAVAGSLPAASVDIAVVFLPRAKAEARARVAEAMAAARDRVIIDGQKTDGVEAVLKDMRRRCDVGAVFSKAHGKLFSAKPSDAFAGWIGQPQVIDGRWQTAPGVFSADGIDPGSALLADALPDLTGKVADLGAGWGYLAGTILERCPNITELHLVEAHAGALDCARANVPDPRAQFHWADVQGWQPPARFDAVVMNPPFHTGRKADPALGRAFIAASARALRPGGMLWMVANRHLPYEQALADHFAETQDIGGSGAFKLFRARR